MGIIAAFLYAILTERALVVEWPGPVDEHIGNLLHSPYFDWMPPEWGENSEEAGQTLTLDTRLGREAVRRELSTFDWRTDHPVLTHTHKRAHAHKHMHMHT